MFGAESNSALYAQAAYVAESAIETFKELPAAPGYFAAKAPTTPAPLIKLVLYVSPLMIFKPAVVTVAVARAVVPDGGGATVTLGADE